MATSTSMNSEGGRGELPDLSAWRIRSATIDDLEAFHALALATGGGFTTFPADRDELRRKLERHERSLGEIGGPPGDQQFILLLENPERGIIAGTGNICACLGGEWPFYSYRQLQLTHVSKPLNRLVPVKILQLVNEFDGATEVGGLFLSEQWRRGGLGRLLARSRYMFIAQHRACFADRVVAEMRGFHSADGKSAFWDAVGRHFFQMEYMAADHYNAIEGNQFISDLMPKFPIYVATLPQEAQAVIGRPHRDGRRAYELLLEEGFRDDGCVDIFDAGPTLWTLTDQVRAIRESVTARIARIGGEATEAPLRLACAGEGRDFRAGLVPVIDAGDGNIAISERTASLLGLRAGDMLRHVAI